MDYCDISALENYRLKTIAANYQTQVGIWITAMSRFADERANITLVSQTPSTKNYDGNNARELVIDPVRSISEVTKDGTEVTPLEYPANRDLKYSLWLENGYWSAERQGIGVTGIHARFETVPKDLEFAVTVLTSLILDQTDDQRNGKESVKLYNYSVSFANQKERQDYEMALSIIDSYKRYAF